MSIDIPPTLEEATTIAPSKHSIETSSSIAAQRPLPKKQVAMPNDGSPTSSAVDLVGNKQKNVSQHARDDDEPGPSRRGATPKTNLTEDVEAMDLDDFPTQPDRQWTPAQMKAFFEKLQQMVAEFPRVDKELQSAGRSFRELLPLVGEQYNQLSAALGRNSAGTEWNQQELWHLKSLLQAFEGEVVQARNVTKEKVDAVACEVIRQNGQIGQIRSILDPIPGHVQYVSNVVNKMTDKFDAMEQKMDAVRDLVSDQSAAAVQSLKPMMDTLAEGLAKVSDTVARQGKWMVEYDRDGDNIPDITSDIMVDAPEAIKKHMSELEFPKPPERLSDRHKSTFLTSRSTYNSQKERAKRRRDTSEPLAPPSPVVVHLGDDRDNNAREPRYTMSGGRPDGDDLVSQNQDLRRQIRFLRKTMSVDGGDGGEPPNRRKRRATGDDPSDPGSSDDDDDGHRPRRSTPPKRQRLFSEDPIDRAAGYHEMQLKETLVPDPPKFNMERGSDYRPYIRGCERYIRLRGHRFPTEESKVMWAIGFLTGDRGNTFGEEYEEKCFGLQGARYCQWDQYKRTVIKACESGAEGIEAIQKMEDWEYRGDMGAYIDKLQYYNKRAHLTGDALRKAVMISLPKSILEDLHRYDDRYTDSELWENLARAGRSHERYVSASKALGSNKRREREKTTGNSSAVKNEASTSSSGGSKPKKSKSRFETKKPEKSGVKKTYEKRFNTLEEATKGIPLSVAKSRMEKGQCPRCTLPGHKSLWCAKELVTASVQTDQEKEGKKTKKGKEKANEPKVQAVVADNGPGGRIYELDDEFSDFD